MAPRSKVRTSRIFDWKGKGKGNTLEQAIKVQRGSRYVAVTFCLTSALFRDGCSTSRLGHFTWEREPVPILQEGVRTPGISRLHAIRTPVRAAHRELLYRLGYLSALKLWLNLSEKQLCPLQHCQHNLTEVRYMQTAIYKRQETKKLLRMKTI